MRWLGPWSASSGAQSRPSANPPPRRTTVATASRSRLFRDHVLKAGPGKYGEDAVVQREEREVAARVAGDRRAGAADEHRERNREEEHREQQLARPSADRHRRKQH